MHNTFQGTVARHDLQAGITYLCWGDMAVRMPLAAHLQVDAPVTWEIPADQVRLPSNSQRPARPLDSPFAATVVRIELDGENIHAVCTAQAVDGCNVLVIADTGIARAHGVVQGSSLVLRLRGEHIRVRPAESKEV